ncbi:YraN family protein [Candidatus Gracilibacteria bacterium]|nr:YraN family protein [Candidatus Gracilibacteria bacterium]
MQTTKQKGDNGELIAIKYLKSKGFEICDTNFKFGRFGEIDIIAEKEGFFYFFELDVGLQIKTSSCQRRLIFSQINCNRFSLSVY